MKVSVIIPVYKVEKYLEKCLDSVVEQNFSGFEILCIDDCSPDNCAEIIKRYKKRIPNLKYIKNEKNGGLSYSRNVGLKAAIGEYVWFLDSDDYIKNDSLRKLYNIASDNDLDVVYFDKEVFYEEDYSGKRYQYLNQNFDENVIRTGKEMFVCFLKKNKAKGLNAYTQFCKRDFLINNNLFFYEGIVHEDWLFYFYVAMKAKRTVQINDILYCYRIRNNSITNEKNEINKYSIYAVLFNVLDYWRIHRFTREEDAAIERFCEMIYGSCKSYSELYADIHDEKNVYFKCNADVFLYKKLTGIESISFDESEKNRLRKANRVLMYGAGRVGLETVTVLTREGIDIDECFVTKLDSNQKKFLGWNLSTIDDILFDDKSIVVVAAKGANREAMIEKLKERGISNYILAVKK